MDGRPQNTTPTADQIIGAFTTSPARSRNMAAIRRVDTKPERLLRSELHRLGYRFRKDYAIKAAGRLIRPDIAFTRWRVAIFVDGCFWHCCPYHGRQPHVNSSYWSAKLRRNVERDALQTMTLREHGWTIVRVWEHDVPGEAARIVSESLTLHNRTRTP